MTFTQNKVPLALLAGSCYLFFGASSAFSGWPPGFPQDPHETILRLLEPSSLANLSEVSRCQNEAIKLTQTKQKAFAARIRKVLLKASKRYDHSVDLKDLHTLLPHLSSDQIEKIVEYFAKDNKDSFYFAYPAIKVAHSYHVLALNFMSFRDDATGERTYTDDIVLRYAYPDRAPESYIRNEKFKANSEQDIFGKKEAIQYAVDNYPSLLTWDSWQDVLSITLSNPKSHCRMGGCEAKAVLYLGINRDWNELSNAHKEGKSLAERLNDSIEVMTMDRIIGDEIRGGRGSFQNWNCILCGGGLSLDQCTGCKTQFPKSSWMSGCDMALPLKVRDYLLNHSVLEDEKAAQKTYEHYLNADRVRRLEWELPRDEWDRRHQNWLSEQKGEQKGEQKAAPVDLGAIPAERSLLQSFMGESLYQWFRSFS